MSAGGNTPAVPRARVLPARKHRKLTKAELAKVYAKVQHRILKEGGKGPFGVFAVRRGGGRVFKLISTTSSDYDVQVKLHSVLHHMIGTYDGSAELMSVWEDLLEFGGRAGA